jgi:hypothetical protein
VGKLERERDDRCSNLGAENQQSPEGVTMSMIWWAILLQLVLRLVLWLVERLANRETLSPKDIERLNTFIWRARRIEEAGVQLGCTAGGTPEELPK